MKRFWWSIIAILMVCGVVWAADYSSNKTVNQLTDVSGNLVRTTRIVAQDSGDTDVIGAVTPADIFGLLTESDIPSELARLASPTFTGTVVLPSNQALLGSPTVETSIDPDTADGATIGSATKEWSDLYLASSGVIYGENDQSNTLTSSATGWTANLNLAAATYGSDGSVSDAELLYINTLTSNAQTQIDAKEDAITEGSIHDGYVVLDDLKGEAKWTREAIITNTDPYDVTPSAGWANYHEFDLFITPHTTNVTLRLTKTGPPDDGTLCVINNVGANDIDMDDVGAQQEIPNDGTITIAAGEYATFKYDTDRWRLLSSELSAASFSTLNFNSSPSEDNWSGLQASYTAGENLAQWDLVYIKNDSGTAKAYKWDADLATYKNYKPIGVALDAITSGNSGNVGVAFGIGTNAGWSMTSNQDEGKTVYGSTTAGALTLTAPSTSGDIVCAVGSVLEENTIQFNFGLCTTTEVP